MTTRLVHLMSEELLPACGSTGDESGVRVAPFTTPQRITCPVCRGLIEDQRTFTLESDHVQALAENAAHDAAMTKAQDITPELLTRYADAPRPMPHALRQRLRCASVLRVPPARHA